MDSSKIRYQLNPREKANILSVLFWWWTISLFKTGYRKVLHMGDLFKPLEPDRSTYLGDRLEARWKIELENSKKYKRGPSLLSTILRTFLWEYSILGMMQILNEFILSLGIPILLGGLLRYFKNEQTVSYEIALLYAGGICIATAVNVITINQAVFGALRVGAKIRVAVCSVLYRKALRLSHRALGETAPGMVVNLVASDVNRFDVVSVLIHHMWSAPLSALLIGYFLYTEAGYAGLIGILAVFVVVPIQSYMGKLSSKFRLQTSIKTDERVRLMDEIIFGVQAIKMYAWEKPFSALVALARKLELGVVIKSSYVRGVYMTFNLFTTRMALYCTLVSMLLFGNELTIDKVFVFSSYFNILAHTMGGMFVRGFAEIAECLVAIKRLQNFLLHEEFNHENVTTTLTSSTDRLITSEMKCDSVKSSKQDIELVNMSAEQKRCNRLVAVADNLAAASLTREENSGSVVKELPWAVRMMNATAKWNLNQTENILEGLNVEMERGKLYAVIGMVGTGKSSFLSAILGEINLIEGKVEMNGKVSYASQESWLFSSTVMQNILFGQAYDRQRYQQVVKACALLRDFGQFPQGDQTFVGERGSSLSGGQKARINLARALYKQADVYLLDDPLSAVDAHISKHLFEECILNFLSEKTRILATHQLQYIKRVDGILLFEHGTMKLFADYQDLLVHRPEYKALLAVESEAIKYTSPEKSIIQRQLSSLSNVNRTLPNEASGDGSDDEEKQEDNNKLIDSLEGTSRGKVTGPIFIKYFQIGSNLCLATAVLFLFICTQFIASLNDYFVPFLVDAEEQRHYQETLSGNYSLANNVSNEASVPNIMPKKNYIYIYTAIVIGIFVVGISRSFTFYKTCMVCSQRLHGMALNALIRTSMRFFDINPSGRILNRFSKDMGAVDELLPKAILDAGQIIMAMVGSLIVACTVNPLFIIPIVCVGTIFYGLRKVYLKTSNNIKRLEGIARSPLLTHLNATLNGLTTIRAYGVQDILKREFDDLQDVHTSTMYMIFAASTAFGFSLDVFCCVFASLVTFSFLLLNRSFSGSYVGLVITQVMAMTGMIQKGMQQSAVVANQMMAVERVLEYTQLPAEPNLREAAITFRKNKQNLGALPTNALNNWPSKGFIKFKSVCMRYSDEDPPVLTNLNLIIHPSEKIGIVGRTGAGKSSLILALFRLAKVEGVIEIDGIDTGCICLEDLRSKISIIPQDPVLFSGTLRHNLDPFNEFSDNALWEALEEVELKRMVIASGNSLECRVLDRGSNYSVGQRQLVSLARAILRNNRILILDEATANVDPQTDNLIQRTIRKKFAVCTVLTVAHRLNTIIDSDKVLIMEKGRMVEYGHPHILLQNDYGHFTALAKKTGRAAYDQLVRIARKSYGSRHGEH